MSMNQAGTMRAAARPASRSRRRLSSGTIATHAVLLLGVLVFMFPFYWMVTSSLKPLADIYITPVPLWPPHPIVTNYLEVLGLIPSEVISARGDISLARALVNSMIIGTVYTVAAAFLASLGGYAFAKMRFRGRNGLFLFMLATMMIPSSVGLIPNYMIMAKLGWVNTWWPLIVPGLAAPFSIFWMRQYMTTVPDEMLEAAKVDGCGPFGIYWRVVVPVVAPGLAALTIFNFMNNWNAFMGPLIYLNDARLQTTPLYLALLSTASSTGHPSPANLTFAAATISVLPILALFLGAQRYFIAGLTAGSIK
jgi:ABC-type glycerol-3-phosphate transport system permease component